MATEKRERQRANRQAKLAEERRLESKDNTRQRVLMFGVIAVLLAGGLFLLSQAGGDDGGEEITTPLTLGTTTTVATDDGSTDATEEPTGECPAADGSSPQTTSFDGPPPTCIDPTKAYSAEVVTNFGTFTMELDAARAPGIVNNFVVLARYHYYDGAPFHRIIEGFMIQGGDAVGEPRGTGNPGYQIPDELPEAGEYEIGSVAMANSGPDTNGSQFFVVTGESGVNLPPAYSLFGTVIEGMDVVTTIETLPTNANDAPDEEVIIETITITES